MQKLKQAQANLPVQPPTLHGDVVTFKYTQEITDRVVQDYRNKIPVEKIAAELRVPARSVIAKLSSLGVYERKPYLNKRGEVPQPKHLLIEQLAARLDCPPELLDSLEKCTKVVLQRLLAALADPQPPQS